MPWLFNRTTARDEYVELEDTEVVPHPYEIFRPEGRSPRRWRGDALTDVEISEAMLNPVRPLSEWTTIYDPNTAVTRGRTMEILAAPNELYRTLDIGDMVAVVPKPGKDGEMAVANNEPVPQMLPPNPLPHLNFYQIKFRPSVYKNIISAIHNGRTTAPLQFRKCYHRILYHISTSTKSIKSCQPL